MLEPQPDRLDEALERALASYGKAPERKGLEQRVLARVTERAKHTQHRPRTLWITLAAAAAMGCLFFWEHPQPATPRLQNETLTVQAATPAPTRDLALVLPRAIIPRRVRNNVAEPKLAQFPAPVPMGSQERALLRLAAGDPKNIPRELTHPGAPVESIQIAAIAIKPIQ